MLELEVAKLTAAELARQSSVLIFESQHLETTHKSFHSQVSTHVAQDHQTYSALAQHTQITWTSVVICVEPSRVGRWRLGYIT